MKSILKLFMLVVLTFSISTAITSCGDDEPDYIDNGQVDNGGSSPDDNTPGSDNIHDFEYNVAVYKDAPVYYDPDTKEYTYSLCIAFGVENMYSKDLATFGMVVTCDDGDIWTSTNSNDKVRAEKYGQGYYIYSVILTDALKMSEKSILVDTKKSRIKLRLTPRWGFSFSNTLYNGATIERTIDAY